MFENCNRKWYYRKHIHWQSMWLKLCCSMNFSDCAGGIWSESLPSCHANVTIGQTCFILALCCCYGWKCSTLREYTSILYGFYLTVSNSGRSFSIVLLFQFFIEPPQVSACENLMVKCLKSDDNLCKTFSGLELSGWLITVFHNIF